MKQNMLTESWGVTKDTLLEGLGADKKDMVSKVLDNTRGYLLQETAAAGSMQAHDIAGFRKTLLPLIRRVIPGTIASEIVGVQPMNGPVAQIYSLRYQYKEAASHDPTHSQFGGYDIADGDEAFGNEKPIRQFYSGSNDATQATAAQAAGASGIGQADIAAGTASGTGLGWGSTSDSTTYSSSTVNYGPYSTPVGGTLLGGSGSTIEGSGGRKMAFKIVSQAVEANTRKLQAGWTIETMQDANSQHGIDVESEITKVMSAEIVQEIDAEIINDLLSLAGTVRTYDFNQNVNSYAPAFVGDRFANLGVRINEVADQIAAKTRRGSGNFVVVSPMVVSVLRTAAKAVFAPAVEGSFKGPNNTMLVGTLNGTIKVYSYLWNQAQPGFTGGLGSDKVLVGYKGGNGETDAGYFYAPYVPVMSSGVIVDPVNFQPRVSLMTRYGKVAFTNPTTSLGNSADYYGRITLTNLDFI